MNAAELKQAMREGENAAMHYLLPQRLQEQILKSDKCSLSLGAGGSVMFTDADGHSSSLATTYRDRATRKRIMIEHGLEPLTRDMATKG